MNDKIVMQIPHMWENWKNANLASLAGGLRYLFSKIKYVYLKTNMNKGITLKTCIFLHMYLKGSDS